MIESDVESAHSDTEDSASQSDLASDGLMVNLLSGLNSCFTPPYQKCQLILNLQMCLMQMMLSNTESEL